MNTWFCCNLCISLLNFYGSLEDYLKWEWACDEEKIAEVVVVVVVVVVVAVVVVVVVVVVYLTIVPFALVGYATGYSQLGATRLVGYLPSHIQQARME